MPTRSRVLFAALFTVACLTWLAPWLREDTSQQRLALQGTPRRALADTHAPGDVGPIDAPIAAPTRAGRAAALPTTSGAAVEPSGLVVRLRDPAGAALVDVPVRFAAVGTARTLAQSLNRYVRTDTTGEARLSAGEVEALFGAKPGGRISIECFQELPAATQRAWFPRQPLPAEPIDLVVDAAPVYVGAVLPTGELCRGEHGVLWRYERGWYGSTACASRVRIWVVRGEPYLVRVSGVGLYEPVEASFPAITALERERVHDLQLDKTSAGVRATLLTPDGVPLPEDTLVELRSSRNHGHSDDSSVHDAGEVRFPVHPSPDAAERRAVWLVVVGRGPLGHGRWRKEVAYDVPPPGDWTDLGEVTLEAEPLLVAGRVVTPAGVPLDDIGVEVESIDGDGRWARLPDLGNCVWLDETGAFAIHGPAPDAPMRVRAVMDFRIDLHGHAAIHSPITAPGRSDVVVRIVDTGAVRLHVVGGDEDVSYWHLEVRSTPEDGTEPRTLDADEVVDIGEAEDERTFILRRLPPGEVTITLRAEGDGVALGAPLRIPVRAGELTDGGVLTIDDDVRWIELTVTETGVASAEVVRYGSHGGPLTLRAPLRGGVARLGLRGARAVDVVVGGESTAPVFLADVQMPCTVVLNPSPTVTIEVAGLQQLATALSDAACGRSLVVQLSPLAGEAWSALAEPWLMLRHCFDMPLDDAERMRDLTLLRIAPGHYAVRAAIVRTSHAHERWLGPEHGYPFTALGELEVVPDLSRQAARIQVDPMLR